jgi:hypothetical protein
MSQSLPQTEDNPNISSVIQALKDEIVKDKEQQEEEQRKTESKSNEPQKKPKIPFTCADCGLSEDADYYGRKPYFCRTIVFHEDSYICRDPFSPQASNNTNFLLLGSNCSVCKEMTCQECSVFYTKRLCAKCAISASQYLPQQLKINKVNNKD